MPNRILRDWTDSETIDKLSVYAERFFTRLIMKVDDFGRISSNTKILKNSLFILKDDVRDTDISRWLDECYETGLILIYEVSKKGYLQINDFKQTLRQKLEKYPPPGECITSATHMHSNGIADVIPETNPETETEKKQKLTPKGVGETIVSPPDHPHAFAEVKKDKVSISDFIKKTRPAFIEPYVELWNLFAAEKSLAKISKISTSRRRKFIVRFKEKGFDFLAVLKKASQSEFLLTGKWFGFDWIFENDSNYLKIIEGSYDKNNEPGKVKVSPPPVTDLQYLYERYLEGDLDKRVIVMEHWTELSKKYQLKITPEIIKKRMSQLLGGNDFSETQLYQDYEKGEETKLVAEDKVKLVRIAVLDLFEKLKKKTIAPVL